jgi:hypothetical protein
MARRRVDLDRLVQLTFTPTEAVMLEAMLTLLQRRAIFDARVEPQVKELISDTIERINLQLAALQWPATHRVKAPYPI